MTTPQEIEETDKSIAECIANIFQAQVQIPADNIKVEVHKGVVTLTGEVDDEFERLDAEKHIEDVKGIKFIDNEITIRKHSMAVQTNNPVPARTDQQEANKENKSIGGPKLSYILPYYFGMGFYPNGKSQQELDKDYTCVMTIGIIASISGAIALAIKAFVPGALFASMVFAGISIFVQNLVPLFWWGIPIWPWTISALESKEIFKIWAIWSFIVFSLFAMLAFSVLNSINHATDDIVSKTFDDALGVQAK
jgi:hypothetical protein